MKITFIGLGVMGSSMASNLVVAGHDLTVHNRTREKEGSLEALGARRATSPAEASRGADVVITMLPDSPELIEVVDGENGIASSLDAGSMVIDMSTIDPSTAIEIGHHLGGSGIDFVDAPVSGGSEGAKNGTLSIMAGGSVDAFERARPIFEVLGETITHVGPSGMGQVAKAVNQVIVAGTFMAVAEGLRLAVAAGLDGRLTLKAITQGAAGSWALSQRGPKMLERDYPLGFKVDLHRKDLRIALGLAQEKDLLLPVATLVANAEDSLIRQGHGGSDVSALYESLWN